MKRKKILLQTNNPRLMTGLSENGRELMKYFLKCQDKYEFVYYCTQSNVADPSLQCMPCKAYGCIPADQNILNQLNQDPLRARDCAYGNLLIDEIMKQEKPDIWIGSDDEWSFAGALDKPYFNVGCNSIFHITIDSVPVLEGAYDKAKKTPHFFTWAKFAADEMKRRGPEFSHVKHIYGATDISRFEPVPLAQKNELRKQFGIDPKTTIIGFVSRNQLRKQFPACIMALAQYKKENPSTNIKLHLHCSYIEKQMGWDIPKLAKYYGLGLNDILVTYICRNCGRWHVFNDYPSEERDCPYCGAQRAMITPTIGCGIPHEEMKYLYGLWDAGINAHTSGGQEFNCVNTLLCGLPLGVTNYASGMDFCEQPFVTALNYETTHEAQSSFAKAATSPKSIAKFYDKIVRMNPKQYQDISEKGRAWAAETFSGETIGRQWETVFDAMPDKNWESVVFTTKEKNDKFPMPENCDDKTFITALYKNILFMEEGPESEGFKHWQAALSVGKTRQQIYEFFIQTARQENQKNQPPPKLEEMFEPERTEKKLALVLPQSAGDIIMATSLLKSARQTYPGWRIYFICEPKYNEILEPLVPEWIDKIIPFRPEFENQLFMEGQWDNKGVVTVAKMLHFPTQRQLNYLNNGKDKIAFDLKHRKILPSYDDCEVINLYGDVGPCNLEGTLVKTSALLDNAQSKPRRYDPCFSFVGPTGEDLSHKELHRKQTPLPPKSFFVYGTPERPKPLGISLVEDFQEESAKMDL